MLHRISPDRPQSADALFDAIYARLKRWPHVSSACMWFRYRAGYSATA